MLRRTNPERASDVCGAVARRCGPWLPAHRIGQANLRAAFPDTEKTSDWELLRLEMLMLAQRNPAFAARCQELYKPQRARVAQGVRQLFDRAGLIPPVDDDVLTYSIMSLRLGAALLHAKKDEVREYKVPSGKTVKVKLLKAEPYHA